MIRAQCTNMKGHSYLQHWPVFILPGSMYKQHSGLLPACLEILSCQLRQGFFEGFDVPGHGVFYMALTGAKGDLKWFARVGNLSRSFEHLGSKNALEMCHECSAGSAHLPYEDVASEVPCWAQSVYSRRPWQQPPSIARIPYNNQQPETQFRRDMFHVCKVGVFRDFIASAILLLASLGYYGERGGLDSKLSVAHSSFKLYCSTNHRTPGLRSFTKRFFNAPSAAKFPFANSKGSDTMLIMKWLSVFCVGCTTDLIKEEHLELMNVILLTAKAGCNMFNIMYNHGLFLTAPCAATLWSELRSFIRGYALLAHRSHYDFQFHGFSMKPKLHLLRHQELELFQRLQDPTCQYFFNPISYGCEMNEDYIGRCCRLSRRCDSRLLVQRVLESVLLKGELLHRRWLASGPRNGRSSTKKAKARLRAR